MFKYLSLFFLAFLSLCISFCKAPSPLLWYETCGDPVCMDNGYRPKPGIALCTSAQKSRQSCNVSGEMCDPVSNCNSLLLCTDRDPTQNPGGCPISVRKAKTDIQYLGDGEYEDYLERIAQMKLAHYRYTWDPKDAQPHLGFIIDDVAVLDLPAVASNGKTVNLYGYISMAVAAIKAQNQEIAQLKWEVDTLKGHFVGQKDSCVLNAQEHQH